MKKIKRIDPCIPQLNPRKKVAAYARISMETERIMHSLSAQISYYSELIQKKPEWEYAGVYADEAVTGTRVDKRNEFQRLIEDCESGKIDIILTKSISRFARNTVDLLETVRHLKELGIEVRFEKERINSLSEDGELMMTLLASFAQEEVVSISENVKWIRRNNFKKGKPQARFHVFGYRWDGWQLCIEPREAEIVRAIFDRYLKGDSIRSILEWLKENEVRSSAGRYMTRSSLDHLITNPLYKGDLVLQKSYVADPISKHRKMNYGELPFYMVKGNHEAIIPPDIFEQVQEFRKSRKDNFFFVNNKGVERCFTGKIRCGICGKTYWRRPKKPANGQTYGYWRCSTKYKKASLCASRPITDLTIYSLFCEIFEVEEFDEKLFSETVKELVMQPDGSIQFCLNAGRKINKEWTGNPQERGWMDRKRREAAVSEECHGYTGND